MIAIKERIIKSYDDTRYLKLLYNDKKWYQYPQTIYFSFFVCLSFLSFFLRISYQPLFLIVWGVVLFLGFFAIINPWNKRRLKSKMNLIPQKSSLSHWASTEFREAQLEKFYDSMVGSDVLIGTLKDSSLIEAYEKEFLREAEILKSKERLLLGGGVILLFILPIWNTTTSILLSEKKDFNESLKLIFQLIFLIYCLIYFLNLIKFWIEEVLNKTYWKYIDIKRNLHQIRLNIELNKVKNTKQ